MYTYFNIYIMIDVVVLQSWPASVCVCVWYLCANAHTYTYIPQLGTLVHGRKFQKWTKPTIQLRFIQTFSCCRIDTAFLQSCIILILFSLHRSFMYVNPSNINLQAVVKSKLCAIYLPLSPHKNNVTIF